MARKFIDCREYPSDTRCSLYLSGEEEEVLNAARAHAIAVHGAKDDSNLRDELRRALKDERAAKAA